MYRLAVPRPGWGEYLGEFLTIPVVNEAVAGTSARSYTEEGLFQKLINIVKRGDLVIIEFGHNDGYPGPVDNGREDAFGSDYNATETVTDSRYVCLLNPILTLMVHT